jgi:transcriptional regulator GlxA family with amidase domain
VPVSPPGSTCACTWSAPTTAPRPRCRSPAAWSWPPHRDGGQAQWLQRPLPPPGQGLAATCAWALQHLAQPLSVADLAAHAGWAPRTLARRFLDETGLTPLRWLTAQRLLEARRLLEATDLSVDEVAARCGLGTAANLRLHLDRDTGTTPTAYRAAYQGRP